jgi:Ribonuclease G/E
MILESNRELVLRRLVECLGRDRTKHQVAEVTSLGLVQMTRKRVGQGLIEAFSTTCDSCGGRGIHIHTDPVKLVASTPFAGSHSAHEVDEDDHSSDSSDQAESESTESESTESESNEAEESVAEVSTVKVEVGTRRRRRAVSTGVVTPGSAS